MVIIVVALISVLVVAISQSTFIQMRINGAAMRRIKAEYVLKSAINFARVLLRDDPTVYDDPTDPWYPFREGRQVDGSLIGINEPNVAVHLQISSEGGRFPVRLLISGLGVPDPKWRDVLARLFENLGFTNDKNEIQQSGPFKGRYFASQEMVANLIDYMDDDNDSYNDANFARGIESQLDTADRFRNTRIESLDELAAVPGFTPNRLRRIIPLLTTTSGNTININSASRELLKALNPSITDDMVNQIETFRSDPSSGGPFTPSNFGPQLNAILGTTVGPAVQPLVNVSNSRYEILAKVDYGTSSFMARALVNTSGNVGRLPTVTDMELY